MNGPSVNLSQTSREHYPIAMEPIWDLHLSSLMPKDDICVAKYDFDGLGPQMWNEVHSWWVGWFLAGKAMMEGNELINLLIPHKGKQGKTYGLQTVGGKNLSKSD